MHLGQNPSRPILRGNLQDNLIAAHLLTVGCLLHLMHSFQLRYLQNHSPRWLSAAFLPQISSRPDTHERKTTKIVGDDLGCELPRAKNTISRTSSPCNRRQHLIRHDARRLGEASVLQPYKLRIRMTAIWTQNRQRRIQMNPIRSAPRRHAIDSRGIVQRESPARTD